MATSSLLDSSGRLHVNGLVLGSAGLVPAGQLLVEPSLVVANTATQAPSIAIANGNFNGTFWHAGDGASGGLPPAYTAPGNPYQGTILKDGLSVDGPLLVAQSAATPPYAATELLDVKKTTIGILPVGDTQTGLLRCEALFVAPSVLDASIGVGTLVAGEATITTGASDASAKIFLQRTGAAGAATGTLQVTSKGAASFDVKSLDAAGAVVAADVGTFDWWIVTPNYS